MLIEFSVSNFRSIREKQTLSMVASRDKSLSENVIHKLLPGLSNASLLKSAVIYGANASGKSNLLKAMSFMCQMVRDSAARLKPVDPFPLEPFRFDQDSIAKPSEFEIMFVSRDIRYRYGFTLDRKRVHSEFLYAYPYGKAQRWFERSIQADGTYSWEFSQKHFKGEKESLARQTRDNALFLSTAAQFNQELLLSIYGWFLDGVFTLIPETPGANLILGSVSPVLLMREGLRGKLLDMTRSADLGISGAVAYEEEVDSKRIPEGLPPDAEEQLRGLLGKRVKFLHHVPGTDEPVPMEENSESAGTLKYFRLIGYLLTALVRGTTLAVDELDASMHPLLVRALLKAAHSERENPNGAQMIFTTHDVMLLDREVFRRDQVWFTEKDANAATRLYPLTDFQPRKDEALARGYLAGRYGAIPFLTGELAI